MRTLALLAALVLAPLGAQDKEKKEPPPKTIPEPETRIRAVLQKHRAPAVGVAVVNRDTTLWAAGIGKADVAAGRDATADTLFRIGSITKGFVAAGIMMLVEEGRLFLDAPVKQIVPEVEFVNPWESTDPVRVVHLIEHTTGFDDLALAEYASNDPKPLTLAEGLAFRPASRTCRWKPGSGFSYCNSGPAVAARIIERVTGKRFEDFAAERIFRPLGMNSASLLLTPEVEQHLAKGYAEDGKTLLPYWHILMRPAGAVNASPREMAAWVRMHLNRGRLGEAVLLRPETMDRIETPGSSLSARRGIKSGYALGSYTDHFEGFTFHGHNGGMDGYLAGMGYLRGAGLGYVFMVNASNGRAFGDIERLLRGYLTQGLAKPAPASAVAMPSQRLAKWAGFYEPRNLRREDTRFLGRLLGVVRVNQDGANLVAKRLLGGKARKLIPAGEDRFRPEEEPQPDRIFTQDESGERVMVADGAVWVEISSMLALGQLVLGALCLLLMASSVLFALIWAPRKLLGGAFSRLRFPLAAGTLRAAPDSGASKLKGPQRLSVRVAPLLAALSFLGMALILSRQDASIIWKLGNLTFYSASLYLLSLAFPVFSAWAFLASLRAKASQVRRGVRLHSLLCSAAACLVAAYLIYWDFIGVKTWR